LNAISTYFGLFLLAFLAATIFPAQSEAALAGLVALGKHSVFLLILFATAGNVLGSLFNWFLGKEASRFENRKWFPLKADKLEKARSWYTKYGKWSLLLSWVPVIGDPLTLAAGLMNERLSFFIPIVSIAKLGRYIAIWLAVSGLVW
jgi:membrane protein YqaA with SNARE-associated domain